MANTFAPILRPVIDLWNSALGNPELQSLTEFQGGYGSHNGWHTKFLRSEQDQLNNRYLALKKRFNEDPELLDLASDNVLRLTVLSGLERVFAIRQAYQVLKHRFVLPVNTTGTLGEVVNQGFRNGYFKGALLNATQFLGVHYNTLLWAKGTSFTQLLAASSIFETLFHPVDTVKTILYADTQGTYKGALDVLGRVVQEQSALHLFRGLTFKLAYNTAFLLHLKNYYEDSQWQYVTAPLWLFSYGFLSLKTRLQVSSTALSYQSIHDLAQKGAEKGIFRGIVPFALINYLFAHQLYGYYSQNAQDSAISSLRASSAGLRSSIAENYWH